LHQQILAASLNPIQSIIDSDYWYVRREFILITQ